MSGPADYCSADDISARVPNALESEEAQNWTDYIHVASRAIDRFCDRYFYPDPITGVKYFDVEGDPSSGTSIRMLQLQDHDFYGATTIKVALFENADPAVTADWVTLTGDGITPPSDFFLEPANQTYVGKNGDVNRKPFYRIRIPATPPKTSATYQSSLLPGMRTLAIIPTGWGWPAIPDEIKNIAIRAVLRMSKSRDAGETGDIGSPEYGAATITKYLDAQDILTLIGYKKLGFG